MIRRSFLIGAGASLLAPIAFVGRAAAAEAVRLVDLYNDDASFSAFAEQLAGRRVEMGGFMAPPLKAESEFFVLTKVPMALCPFCDSEMDWPTDIIAVYGRNVITAAPFNVPIVTSGVLELGVYTDPELGFVSKLRLVEASYRRA